MAKVKTPMTTYEKLDIAIKTCIFGSVSVVSLYYLLALVLSFAGASQ